MFCRKEAGNEFVADRRCRSLVAGGCERLLDAAGVAAAERRAADTERRGGAVRSGVAHLPRQQRQTGQTPPVHGHGPRVLRVEGTTVDTDRQHHRCRSVFNPSSDAPRTVLV